MGYEDTFRKIKVKDTVLANTLTAVGTVSGAVVSGNIMAAASNVVTNNLTLPVQNVTGTSTNGTATIQAGLITITGTATGTISLTLQAPLQAGQLLVIQNRAATGTVVKINAGTGVTFDGTNQYASFGTIAQQLMLMSTSATRWLVLLNSGGATFGSS